MKYYSAIQRNEVLIDAITWVNLENIMLSEKIKHKRPHTGYFHLYDISIIGKSRERGKINE